MISSNLTSITESVLVTSFIPYERSYEIAPGSMYEDPIAEIVLLAPYRYSKGGTVS